MRSRYLPNSWSPYLPQCSRRSEECKVQNSFICYYEYAKLFYKRVFVLTAFNERREVVPTPMAGCRRSGNIGYPALPVGKMRTLLLLRLRFPFLSDMTKTTKTNTITRPRERTDFQLLTVFFGMGVGCPDLQSVTRCVLRSGVHCWLSWASMSCCFFRLSAFTTENTKV